METVAKHSEHGCWVKCFDDIARHFFPIILLLSADYEEQFVVSNCWANITTNTIIY